MPRKRVKVLNEEELENIVEAWNWEDSESELLSDDADEEDIDEISSELDSYNEPTRGSIPFGNMRVINEWKVLISTKFFYWL